MATSTAPTNAQQIRELIQGPPDAEWRYEMRRDCQQITDGLLLGPFQVSKELNKLKELGVTHIVCIRDSKEAFSVKPRFEGHFTYLVLDVEDSEEQNLIRKFPEAKAFIDNAINNGGTVLVHCNGGISLSPAFVVMFVMEHYHLSWEDALHMVQNRRYCISPNSGFLTQIKEYESIYRAQAAIQQDPRAAQGQRMTRRKREEDEEEADETRYEERSGTKRTQLDPDIHGLGLQLPLSHVAVRYPQPSHQDEDVAMDM